MPVGQDAIIIRQVQVLHGKMTFKMLCQPAFDYARADHQTRLDDNGATFHTDDLSFGLGTAQPLALTESGVQVTFTLHNRQTTTFHFHQIETGATCQTALDENQAQALFKETVDYWHAWLRQCTYTGRWREHVYRSALALKLMTFEPTGAIIAAPTTSLPEGIGGVRNWDYRYSWLRDAGFTVYALVRIGFTQEAEAFMGWLEKRCRSHATDGPLQPLYTIHGESQIPETTLDHLEGYRGSRPVRIGNEAASQFQLHIYGEVLDAIYLYNSTLSIE